MNTFFYPALFFIFLLTSSAVSRAQEIPNRKSVGEALLVLPYFSIHKDNYFASGVPLNKAITSASANAKYQISFKQILARKGMPWDAYLFVTYTQKAFWDIYLTSLPFVDINFNPSLSLGKLIYNQRDELTAMANVSLEHESNGRDSTFSRTWNRISFEYITPVSKNTTIGLKAWIPFGYDDGNADYLEYVGLGEFNLSHEIRRNKAYVNVMARKGLNFEAKGVLRSRFYYSPFKNNRSNQYLMLEWYLGQAESMLEYKDSRSMLRIGYVIRSNEYDLFRGRN